MRDSLKRWWRTRTVREQGLLLVMVGLAVIVFAWLAVVRPLGDALSKARERHGEAVVALAETQGRVRLISAIEQRDPVKLDGSVEMIVSRAAADAGFAKARVTREGAAQATIVLDAVRPQAFFAWVARLEREGGLVVERLSAATNSDRTLSAEVTFRARAG